MPVILTAGYGQDDFEGLKRRIQVQRVDRLVDVRSNPFSKHQEDFRRPRIDRLCEEAGIKYTFMGLQLGGKPSDPELQTNGQPDFKKIAKSGEFRSGMAQVIEWSKAETVCLLCGCEKPMRCHRGTLLGPELMARDCTVHHIDEEGRVLTQDDALERETGGQMDLFGG
jgi:uncharacterized protein (DUF488 family)